MCRTVRRRFRKGLALALVWRNFLAVRVIHWLPQHLRLKAIRYIERWFWSPGTSPHQHVNRCIYCRSTIKRLTDEHIVPEGLGGQRVLFRASCTTCQKKIDAIENACLHKTMLRDIRYRRGIGERNKEDRPTDLEAWVKVRGDESEVVLPPGLFPGGWEIRRRPYSQHPTFFVLPILKPPGVLRGVPQRDCNEADAVLDMWHYVAPFDTASDPPLTDIYTEVWFSNPLFVRMIAKIAHGVAVWEFGLDNIEPVLPPLILGDDPSLSFYLVGGGAPANLPPSKTPLHLEVLRTTTKEIHVIIRLFADLTGLPHDLRPGAPVFHVVVGRHLKNLPT